MTLTEQLVLLTATYCEATGTGRGTLSARLLGKGSRLAQMAEDGADLNTKSWERAVRWLSENWPDDLEWPSAVLRPAAFSNSADVSSSPVAAGGLDDVSYPVPADG